MLASAEQIRKTLNQVSNVATLLKYVAGEFPTGGEVYRGTPHPLCPNMITPLTEVSMIFIQDNFYRHVVSIVWLLLGIVSVLVLLESWVC